MDAQGDLPLKSGYGRPPEPDDPDDLVEPNPDLPEFGFNPLAIIATVKRISAELAAIRAFLVRMAPVLDAIKAAMGNPAPTGPGEFSTAAEQFRSTPFQSTPE